METKFAPAKRADKNTVEKQVSIFREHKMSTFFMDSVPTAVLILNSDRQIIFSNSIFGEMIGLDDVSRVYGLRTGEAVGCIRANIEKGGCGTSEFCSTCGAVQAILKSANTGRQDKRECRIILENNRALDLMVWATPFKIEGEAYTIFSVVDISHEKRRRALEKIFFHDILNTAGGLKGFIDMLEDADDDEKKEFIGIIGQISEKLIDEIMAQKEVSAAENNEVSINISRINSLETLHSVAQIYENHLVARGKKVTVDRLSSETSLITDKVLLRRVLGNMTKNALEASAEGSTITLGCIASENNLEFWVHNPGFIPRKIQLQIFQRSFSTKGNGRGLGTYSMKLLASYINSEVSFSTSESGGTIFKIITPYNLKTDG